jgi:tetratricopeptide (TPR) repeat protein
MTDAAHNFDEMASTLLQLAGAKSGDELLAFSVDQILAGADARKAEILRRCAVPRWFDASVLGLLREKSDDNERFMLKLREYSFVRDLSDGRLAYHDRVRETLLSEWERDRPEELRKLHLKLYAYFNERVTPLGSARRALPSATGSMVMSVVPMSVQADLWRREAIYHLLCADEERGLAELRRTFNELEENHRQAEAEQLLQMAAETEPSARLEAWLTFMRARTRQSALDLEEAARGLEELLAQPGLDPELEAEAYSVLGETRAELGQWAVATSLYYHSLAAFERAGKKRAVADTMLLLGEAYQNLGISTGSWHVSYRSRNRLFAIVHDLYIWLLSLPFMLLGLFMGRSKLALPTSDKAARYQNWLLIRLYNTARSWFVRARAAYAELQDESGVMRAEQRLADILLLYGYHGEAIKQVNELLKQPLARDPYRRAWLKRSLAEGHLVAGDVGSAQLLLSAALQIFREIGDIRREASILALQGKAAAMAGNIDGALSSYHSSLERFRNLRYAAARERILHDLREWKNDPNLPASVMERIDQTIADEPEKRYVGRFVRRYLIVLQIASIIALPLAALLVAIVAPTSTVQQLAAGVFAQGTIYDPFRSLGVLILLVPFYMAVYAALGAGVIFFLPLDSIEREQPDVIVTNPNEVARYNRRGELVKAMPWQAIRRWITLDRRIWNRPLPLYSRTFLEDGEQYDLGIDGITGWYIYVQDDIARHLAAIRAPVRREELGYSLLKSGQGLSVVVGILLLPLVTAIENGWLQLPTILPTVFYGALHTLAFSGVLILVPLAYWLAYRPLKLQRTLQLHERWPLVIGGGGLLAVLGYLAGGPTSVAELNMAMFVWGIYLLSEALVALWRSANVGLRPVLRIGAVLFALAIIARPAYVRFQTVVAQSATQQASDAYILGGGPNSVSAGAAAQASDAAQLAQASGGDLFTTNMLQGYSALFAGDNEAAIEGFLQAANTAETPTQQALALYNLFLAYEKVGDTRRAQAAYEQYRQLCGQPGTRNEPVCLTLSEQGAKGVR